MVEVIIVAGRIVAWCFIGSTFSATSLVACRQCVGQCLSCNRTVGGKRGLIVINRSNNGRLAL